jgi:speckle-type POZ protein
MTQISSNKWSEVEWPYQPSKIETDDKIEYEDITLGLLLAYKSASETDLVNQYAKVLENQTMGDIKLIVQGREMTAHGDILVAASPVMAAMLAPGKFKEGETKTIPVPDIEPTVFEQVLKFIYTGSAPRLSEKSITKPLYLAADKYQLDTLKIMCEEDLIQHLTLGNAVKNFLWAQYYNLPQLKEASKNFLVKYRKNEELWNQPGWKELAKTNKHAFFEISCEMMSE